MALLPTSTDKTDAVRLIAAANSISDVNPWSEKVDDIIENMVNVTGAAGTLRINWMETSEVPAVEGVVFGAFTRQFIPPVHLSGRPDCFPPNGVEGAFTPELKLLTLPRGVLWNFAESPVILSAENRAIHRRYSSRYSKLIYFYDVNLDVVLDGASYIDGTAIVLFDDIRPLNFCHWLIDWLPRLVVLGNYAKHTDCFVLTTPITQKYQLDALAMCGFDASRIIGLQNFQAVRARQLLVTDDLSKPCHPALKAAPQYLSYLKSTIALRSMMESKHFLPNLPRKLYISRADATGRRILNENDLYEPLRRMGYARIILSKLSLSQQAALFVLATHVVGLHGAGLAHVSLMAESANVVEIFPATYGTPAFYVLTAGLANRYVTYIATDVTAGSRSQTDDVTVDVADFLSRSMDFL